MHEARFYVRAGLSEKTSSGKIDTSAKDFQSPQRAWLPEVRRFNVCVQKPPLGFPALDETQKINNLIENQTFLLKTVLCSERIKFKWLKKRNRVLP